MSDRAERFLAEVPLGEILLVSDYGKGVCTRRLLESIGTRAHEADIPILVDPARSRDWSDYGQVTLIKANRDEATEAASGLVLPPLSFVRWLTHQHKCHVVVTLGRHGMLVADVNWVSYFPAKKVVSRDVCGAGDTVLAALGVTLAKGKNLKEAVLFALNTAANQVATLGIGCVPTLAP